MRRAVVLLVAGLLPLAWSQGLRIDDSGGPLTLRDDVETAIAGWQDASDMPFGLTLSDDGEIVVGYGAARELGPETLSLTLQRQGGDGGPNIEVRLSPNRYRTSPTTLLHEIGVLLGLQTNNEVDSVMRPALGSASPSSPSEADIERLAELRDALPEDIDRNGTVDFYDLALLAEAFGAQGINLPADIDRNGVVDRSDLDALRAAYLFAPPSPTPPAATASEPATSEPLPELPPPTAPAGEEEDASAPAEDGTAGPDAAPPAEDAPAAPEPPATDEPNEPPATDEPNEPPATDEPNEPPAADDRGSPSGR